jgi:hypothetical protein
LTSPFAGTVEPPETIRPSDDRNGAALGFCDDEADVVEAVVEPLLDPHALSSTATAATRPTAASIDELGVLRIFDLLVFWLALDVLSPRS